MFGSALGFVLVAFLGAIVCCILEVVKVGEAVSDATIGGNGVFISIAAVVLQLLAVMCVVYGFVWHSGLAYVCGK